MTRPVMTMKMDDFVSIVDELIAHEQYPSPSFLVTNPDSCKML